MSEHRVKVDNGKYTFVLGGRGWRMDVLRHGEPWVEALDATKAVGSMMAELDAARVVLAAARQLADAFEKMPIDIAQLIIRHDTTDAAVGLTRALALHEHLVDDREPPSEWAQPAAAKSP